MGTSGDPSEDWDHTLDVIKKISMDYQLSLFKEKKKYIVIITKHWNTLTEQQLKGLKNYNVCINTSISALDNIDILNNCIAQYERLKPYCKSVLRIISADFNLQNKLGYKLHNIQSEIFKKHNVLDTIFRVSKKNDLVVNGIINIKEVKFLGKKCNISKYNKKAYFGVCENCLDMCNLVIDNTNIASVVAGTPSATPVIPTLPSDKVLLGVIFVPTNHTVASADIEPIQRDIFSYCTYLPFSIPLFQYGHRTILFPQVTEV